MVRSERPRCSAHPGSRASTTSRRGPGTSNRPWRRLEDRLDSGEASWSSDELERGNAVLVRLKDAIWAIGRDRTDTARGIADLAGGAVHGSPSATGGFWALQVALSALDRLEVRGRDSAGLHVLITGHGIDFDLPANRRLLSERASDELFTSLAMRTPHGHLSLVYKVAAEIGELGDNTRVLRAAIRNDPGPAPGPGER